MKLFPTEKVENNKSYWIRILFNLAPLYIATGAKIKFCSYDFKETHVKLTKNLLTRNYVNTIFGGSMYSSIDPIYMLMLMQILGKNYVVWDKAATIRFIKPANKILKCRFIISDELVKNIKDKIKNEGEMNLELALEYLDENEKPCASFTKTLYIAEKNFYIEKRKNKGQSIDYKPRY